MYTSPGHAVYMRAGTKPSPGLYDDFLRRPQSARRSIGGTLRAPLASAMLIASALLITGCGGPGSPAAPEPSAKLTKLAGDTGKRVSLDDTCLELFGHTTLAVDSAKFLIDVSSLDADTAKQADSFDAKLGDVAAAAQPELAKPLQDMQVVFQDFSQAWADSGSWELDTSSYGAAKDKVSSICTLRINALASSATPTPAAALTDEEKFLASVRAVHPSMKSTDAANRVALAKSFCTIYDTATANGKADMAPSTVNMLITKAAGIEYTLQELQTIHKTGVTVFCPQHTDKLR